jgi:hypothetical protein
VRILGSFSVRASIDFAVGVRAAARPDMGFGRAVARLNAGVAGLVAAVVVGKRAGHGSESQSSGGRLSARSTIAVARFQSKLR